MKQKLFILYLCSSLFCFNIHAQDTLIMQKNSKLKIGIKTFFEYSNAYGSDHKSTPIYSFCFQGIYKLSKSKSSIEFGLGELTRAEEYDYFFSIPGNYYYDMDHTFEVYYGNLHLPLAYRIDIRSFYFTVGIYIDYLLRTVTDDPNAFDSLKVHQEYGINRKYGLGWSMGFGFERSISKTHSVFGELEFTHNLFPAKTQFPDYNTTITNIGNYPNGYPVGFYNYGFAFGINYKFPLKNKKLIK